MTKNNTEFILGIIYVWKIFMTNMDSKLYFCIWQASSENNFSNKFNNNDKRGCYKQS